MAETAGKEKILQGQDANVQGQEGQGEGPNQEGAGVNSEALAEEIKQWEKDGKVGPKPGTPRWNHIYYKGMEADRQMEELREQIKAKDRDMGEIRKAYEELSGTVDQLSENQVVGKESEVKSRIKQLRTEKYEAMENKDWAKLAQVEDDMDELKETLSTLKSSESTGKKKKKETGDEPEPTKNSGQDVEESATRLLQKQIFEDFLDENSWADPKSEDFDPVLAGALDATFKAQKSGSFKKKLEKASKDILKRFGNNGSSPSMRGVDSERGAETSEVVQLNEDQRKIAKNMFPNDPKAEERYAKNLDMIQRRK